MKILMLILSSLLTVQLSGQEITKVHTFLMFYGQAEAAMNFYTNIFDDAEIKSISKYGPEGPGTEGTVYQAVFTIKGQEYMCIDSYVDHGFSFTPAISLFVHCESEEEIDALYEKLAKGGKEYMPLGNYGFSTRFGWIEDQFGVSWQLNLE